MAAVLVSTQSISAAYGSRSLFSDLSLSLFEGDRLGLIGPNGAGKSTLLRILADLQAPDSGIRSARNLVRLSYVPQVAAFPEGKTVEEILRAALPGTDPVSEGTRIAVTAGKVGFQSLGTPVDTLSGGWKKRLTIALALISEPDVVMLDEPTNHLDLEGVLWLEKLLLSTALTFIVVTHDRMFLENVATRMVELNRVYAEGCFTVAGNYSEFLMRREQYHSVQAKHHETLKNTVSREVEWLRRNPKAQMAKSKARIDAAGRLIGELADLKARRSLSTATVDFDGSGRRTKELLVAKGLTHGFDGRTLFSGVELNLGPGDRLGLLGGNGTGKTTLLRILTGQLEPASGTVVRADNLQMVYFDQAREHLDFTVTLRQALAPAGGDSVVYRGGLMHVVAWAKKFLFRLDQLDVSVSRLSGGEQARVLIARLMLRPADILVLDEPTNDLDIETLEVLEESLTSFPGAVILVTHDRYMLDRISNSLLGLTGHGKAERFADYSQWEAAQKNRRTAVAPRGGDRATSKGRRGSKTLTPEEQAEWDGMESTIMATEQIAQGLETDLTDPAIAGNAALLAETSARLEAARERVIELYARWAELGARQGL